MEGKREMQSFPFTQPDSRGDTKGFGLERVQRAATSGVREARSLSQEIWGEGVSSNWISEG